MNYISDINAGHSHAVIDIGSNSVRLVIYRIIGQSFIPIHNEKVLAGLGRGISETGELWPKGVEMAINAIKRYKILIDSLEINSVDAIATAASRDAANGPEFIENIVSNIGVNVRLIDGQQEGFYSAIGVKSGAPDATGIMGDLGGSSLELVDLDTCRSRESYKLGPLAIGEIATSKNIVQNEAKIREIIRASLKNSNSVKMCINDEFHAVGGAWRNLAQIHMEYSNYPLKVLNNYTIEANDMHEFCGQIISLSRKDIEKVKGISQRRADSIPYAALLIQEIIEASKAARIIISSNGLREGVLTEKLGFKENILVEGIRSILNLGVEEYEFSTACYNWLLPIFPFDKIDIPYSVQKNLLMASCLMVDVGIGMHPDHRGQLTHELALRAPYPAVNHAERVFIARAIARRYGEKTEDIESNPCSNLINDDYKQLADLVGAGLRLAAGLSSNSMKVLKKTTLEANGDELLISLDARMRDLLSDGVLKRLRQLEQVYQKLH